MPKGVQILSMTQSDQGLPYCFATRLPSSATATLEYLASCGASRFSSTFDSQLSNCDSS